MATTVPTLLNKLKDILHDSSSSQSKQQDPSALNKTFFLTFLELIEQLEQSFDKIILKEEYLLFFEEILSGIKKIPFTKSLQLLFFRFYSLSIRHGPGYFIRNLITSLMNNINNNQKFLTWHGKECILQILIQIILFRLHDCANSITDLFQLFQKVLKSSNEISIKLIVFTGFQGIVSYEEGKLTDLFPETLRTAIRWTTDRSSMEVRVQAFNLLRTMIHCSRGLVTISAESVLPTLIKGLEDDHADVQETVAKTLTAVYELQIHNYLLKQEQSKIGAARGTDSVTSPTGGKNSTGTAAASTSRLSLAKFPSLKKVVVEEVYDYHTIIENLLKNFYKSTITNVRNGYLLVIGHLFSSWIHSSHFNTNDDIEWIITTFFAIPQDPSIQSLSYEDSMYFRVRLSFIFRHCFLCYLTETQLIITTQELIKYCSTLDMNALSGASNNGSGGMKNDSLELYCCLQEVYHLVTVLGCTAATTVIDEIITSATLQLRQSNFSVRLIAANILAIVSLITPGTAVDLLRSSLTNLSQQYKQLLAIVNSSTSTSRGTEGLEDILDLDDIGRSNSVAANENAAPVTAARRRSVNKGDERLQRLYYFHGHSLAIAAILKHEKYIPGGVPTDLLTEIISFALEMMSQDLLAAALSARHFVCSMIRSGGLILSACLSLGYSYIRHRVPEILAAHTHLVQLSSTDASVYESSSNSPLPSTLSNDSTHAMPAAAPNPVIINSDEQIFEIMALEATLIMISSLLLYSSEALLYENDCLFRLIESLETLFRNMKVKYQSYFKQHFRYRTLHITLLEIFTLLPSGSYPNTSQQIFIEALRSFRDGLTSGYECSTQLFTNYGGSEAEGDDSGTLTLTGGAAEEDGLFKKYLSIGPINTAAGSGSINDQDLYWKLENYLHSLPKKEYEAYIFLCSKEEAVFPFIEVDVLPFLSKEKNGKRSTPITRPAQLVDAATKERYYQQRKRLSYQSSLIDSRIMNVSIQLLAITFPHQLSEYQDKAIHLLTQALIQFNVIPATVGTISQGKDSTTSRTGSKASSIVNNLFVSEEEKKKKEKKTSLIVKTILLVFQKIIEWFPIHSGKYFDLDYSWRQTLIDALYALLTYPNDLQYRKYAAESLALFAIKWRGSNIITTVCSRIRTSIMSVYEKNKPTASSSLFSSSSASNTGESVLLYDFTGYVIALTHLFIHSQHLPDVQSLTLTTLFDCLRRVDCHLLFSAHVFTSLSMICQWHVEQITASTAIVESSSQVVEPSSRKKNKKSKSIYLEKDSVENLLEKNLYFIELFLANVNVFHSTASSHANNQEDYHLVYTSILRLLSQSIVLGKVSQLLSGKNAIVIKKLISLWKFVQYYIWKEIFVTSGGIVEAEDEELDPLDNRFLLHNQMTKKYQPYCYQVLLESVELLLRYDAYQPYGSIDGAVVGKEEAEAEFRTAPFLITFVSKLLQRGSQSLLPQPYTTVFTASTFHRFFSPQNLLQISRILTLCYEQHQTLFQIHQFFPFFYTIMELAYKSFCRICFTDLAASPANSGMEIIQDNVYIESSAIIVQQVMRKLLQTMNNFVLNDISGRNEAEVINKDRKAARTVYWILYQRCIVMNVANKQRERGGKRSASSAQENDDEDRAEEPDEEDEDRDFASAKGKGGKEEAKLGAIEEQQASRSFDNIPLLLQYYREEVLLQHLPTTLYSNRSLYKFIAIHTINDIFTNTIGLQGNYDGNEEYQFHSNLIQARANLQSLITETSSLPTITTGKIQQNQKKKFTINELLAIPFSLSCFLNDLLSMACSISTYSINDKNIYPVQNIGMECLYYVIELFVNTLDPDALSSSTAVGGNEGSEEDHRILIQYLSQILGSIRYTFNISMIQHTIIHDYAQKVLSNLVLSGLITDKVMMKRLFKNFVSYWEEQQKQLKAQTQNSPSSLTRKAFKHACYNEWFSLEQALRYEKLLLRYLFFVVLSSPNAAKIANLICLIPSDDYQRTKGKMNKSVITSLQELFGPFSVSLVSGKAISASDPEGEIDPNSKAIIDQLRVYHFSHTENLDEIAQLYKLSSLRSNSSEGKKDTAIEIIGKVMSAADYPGNQGEDIEKFHPARGGWLYTSFVDITLLQNVLEERNFYWTLLNIFSSLASSSPTVFPSSVKILWTQALIQLRWIISALIRGDCSTDVSYCDLVGHVLNIILSLITYQNAVLSPSNIVVLTKDHYLVAIDLLKLYLTISRTEAEKSGMVVLQSYSFLFFVLSKIETLQITALTEKKELFQFFISIFSTSALFALLMKADAPTAQSTVQAIAETAARLSKQYDHGNLVLEWQLSTRCFRYFIQFLSSTDPSLIPKLYALRIYSFLGIGASFLKTSTSLNTTAFHAEISSSFALYTKQELQGEYSYLLSILWNGFLLSSDKNDGTEVEIFAALLQRILHLLHGLYERIQLLESSEPVAEDPESESEKLLPVDALEPIITSILLKFRSSSLPEFRRSLQSLSLFFQQSNVAAVASSTSSTNFNLYLINITFPILLQALIITSPSDPTKLIPPIDFESRTIIQSLVVTLFNYLSIVYPVRPSESSEVNVNQQRETVITKVLALYLPIICQQIQYFVNLSATAGSTISAAEREQTSQYLILIGKSLTSIVAVFANEFRQYLTQYSREEEKQLLQYVMKLSMTANSNVASTSNSSSEGKLSFDKFRK